MGGHFGFEAGRRGSFGDFLALVALIVGALSGAEAKGAELEARLYPSTTKLIKVDGWELPPGAESFRVSMARNEYEGFQLRLSAGQAPVEGVEVVLGDLVGPAGELLSAEEAQLYLEYFVEITFPSPCDKFFSKRCDLFPIFQRDVGWFPDALVPFFDPYSAEHKAVAVPFDVAAGDFQVVFVDLYAPEGQAPGLYSGTISVKVGGELKAELPLEVEVWDFAIPKQRSVATSFRYSGSMADKYHGGADGINTPEEEKIRLNYEYEIHRHRVDPTQAKPDLKFEFDENDNLLPVDWSSVDATIGPRVDGSYYPDGVGVNRFDLGWFAPGRGQHGMTPEQYSKAAKATAEYLESKGWLKHVFLYSTDEPWMPEHRSNGSYDKIKGDSALLHSLTELWKGHVLVTGPWVAALDELVDIWCPVTPMFSDNYWPKGTWQGAEKYAELMSAGKELWFYVCNANFPGQLGYDVDAKLGYEPRLVKWGAWFEKATGFLYWRMGYWQEEDPWHLLVNIPGFGDLFARQGDGILVYPGDHDGPAGTGSPPWVSIGGPVVSYRLKQIRDGLEDWEMLILASSLGAEEYAREKVSTVYSAFGVPLTDKIELSDVPFTLSDAELLEVRRLVAMKVQHLSHPDKYPDPDAPPPVEVGPEQGDDCGSDVCAADAVADDVATVETVGEPDGGVTGDTAQVDTLPTSGSKGGGCSSGPEAPWSPAALLLMLISLVVLRRRRSGAAA